MLPWIIQILRTILIMKNKLYISIPTNIRDDLDAKTTKCLHKTLLPCALLNFHYDTIKKSISFTNNYTTTENLNSNICLTTKL